MYIHQLAYQKNTDFAHEPCARSFHFSINVVKIDVTEETSSFATWPVA